MALTDVKVRNAKPADKPVKLTDGNGMHLLIHPNGSKYWRLQYRFAGNKSYWLLGSTLLSLLLMPVVVEMMPEG